MKVLVPLPSKDFDPTEVAIPWSVLRSGCEIVFATPDGVKALPDPIMLSGEGLGVFASLLKANAEARVAWQELEASDEFSNPISYEEAAKEVFDALMLPGGHAPGMKDYLESEVIQGIAKKHLERGNPVGAICHGILVLARAKRDSGESLLYGCKVTGLPKTSELIPWQLTKKKMGDYYRTYPETTVEDEVRSHLKNDEDFIPGPPTLVRDSLTRLWAGHVVKDGNLVTARWPGDAHLFALKLKELLA